MDLFRKTRLKLLWLQKTYWFQWAHKPLCRKYREDVLQWGHIYLCRSCLCVYLGILATTLVLFFFPSCRQGAGIGLLMHGATTLPLSHPKPYKLLPRIGRDILRFFLGAMFPLLFLVIVQGYFLAGSLVLAVAFVLWKVYYKRRAQRKLQRCHSCGEYRQDMICAGYARHARSIREYEEEATAYLLQSGYVPISISDDSPIP